MNYTASLLPCTSWSEWLHTSLWFQGTLEAAFCLYTVSNKEFEPATFAVFRRAFERTKDTSHTWHFRKRWQLLQYHNAKLEYDMVRSCGFLKIQGRCQTGVLARQQRRSPFKIFKPGWGHPSSSQTTGLKMKTTTVVHYSKSDTTFLCFLFCCKFLPVFKCLYETGLQTSNHVRCIFFLLLKRVENVIVSICQKQLFHALSHIPQVNKLPVYWRKYAKILWSMAAAISVNCPGFILSSFIPAAPYNLSCISKTSLYVTPAIICYFFIDPS